MMRPIDVTFVYLADPVFVGVTERIIPVPTADFCTVFVVIVIVWMPITPVLIVELDHSFREINIIRPGLRITVGKAFCDNNEVLHTGDPSDHPKPALVPRLRPIQLCLEE